MSPYLTGNNIWNYCLNNVMLGKLQFASLLLQIIFPGFQDKISRYCYQLTKAKSLTLR